ncbi:MAG: hypothetical protein IPN13_04070 [Bacteroidetes bacterium]|nr:hypothetical protein [Bacteroidota bacterium]
MKLRGKQVDLVDLIIRKEDMFDSHSYAKGGRVLHTAFPLSGMMHFPITTYIPGTL